MMMNGIHHHVQSLISKVRLMSFWLPTNTRMTFSMIMTIFGSKLAKVALKIDISDEI